jgi:hypothetical protein
LIVDDFCEAAEQSETLEVDMESMMLGNAVDAFFANPGAVRALVVACPGIVLIVGYLGYRLLKERSDNALKRSMVERGLSVEEIERVMQAGKPRKWWQ